MNSLGQDDLSYLSRCRMVVLHFKDMEYIKIGKIKNEFT